MKILPGKTQDEYIIEFSSAQEFENFFDGADQQGFFWLDHFNPPQTATIRATAIGSLRSRRIKPIRIVQEANSCRIVIAEKAPPAPAVAPAKEQSTVGGTESDPAAGEAKREPVATIAEQIRALTTTEKAMLAMKANLAERRVLMQDNNPKIQEFLLRNPRLTESEIAWMARNPMSAIPTLLTIIQRKEWMSADAVRQGIFTNPKTPAHIVLDKIPSLSAGDLIKMYHAKHLREDIRDGVSRQIKKRGIRIPGGKD